MMNKRYKLTDKLNFGQYKNKTLEEIVKTDSSYINWCIINIPQFLLDFDFIEEAVMINPHMIFTPKCLEILDEKFLKYDLSETFDKNIQESILKNYKINLSPERISYFINNRELTLEELEIKRTKKKKQEDLEKEIAYERRQLERERIEELKSNETNWHNYDENLGFGEQSENFWNQF